MSVSGRGTGILFVISAPSGTGKSSVTSRLLESLGGLEFSVSYTTRPARNGELDGREYHFVDRGTFEKMLAEGAFLESAEVFGQLYGTGVEATRAVLATGSDLLLDIDVQGARQVRQGPIEAVSVMILPPDYDTLVERLRSRGSEAQPELERRLAESRQEAQAFDSFDYVVVNDDLDRTVDELVSIVRAERRNTAHCREQANRIIATFPPAGN